MNPVIKMLKLQTNMKEYISKYSYADKNCEIAKAVVQRCSINIGVLKNLAKLTGKHLC